MSLVEDVSSEETMEGSWVEVHFGGNGPQTTCHHASQRHIFTRSQEGDVEQMLLDAQHESGGNSPRGGTSRGSSQSHSPLRASTPVSGGSQEENDSQLDEDSPETRREVGILLTKDADWIWDWSSRPENNPPTEFLLKYPKRSTSPSVRNTSVVKKAGILSADSLKLFLPPVIISHILAVGLGILIGKRIITHTFSAD